MLEVLHGCAILIFHSILPAARKRPTAVALRRAPDEYDEEVENMRKHTGYQVIQDA